MEEQKIISVIIEDEEPARNLIKAFLNDISGVELAGEFEDGFRGLKGIHEIKPDLVFLDIQMPKITGFELLELLEDPPLIIFTTAYDEYAIKAFELCAVDYLLKPFSRERFKNAVEKAKKVLVTQEKGHMNELKEKMKDHREEMNRIVVKDGTEIHIIPLHEIKYFESRDDYVLIETYKGRFLKQVTMDFLESHLPDDFVRIHRSHIVHIAVIKKLEQFNKDNYYLVLKDDTRLKVSRSRIKELREKLHF